MSELARKEVEITIDKKGGFRIEAKNIQGTSCTEATRQLELVLGGVEVGEGKTASYYDGDDAPISINLSE
jgi:hypothetical protein